MADVCVVGPGGVGGYLAAVLAQGGLDVAVVARGAHGDAIERDGLRLDDPQRADRSPARVTTARTLHDAPPAQAVVLAVKHPSLPALCAELPAYLARCPDDSVVLAVQNGVAHLDGPLATTAPDRTLVGSVYIFSHVESPGVVTVLGGPRLYRFGPLHPSDALAARATALAAQWSAAGLTTGAGDDGRLISWEKLCLLAPLSGISALTARTVGEFREVPEMMRTFRTMVDEVRRVAVASGVDVDPALVDLIVAGIGATDPAGRSSLFRDLATGRESELEVLLGDVLRRGDALGVEVPATRAVYAATRVRYGVDVPNARPVDPDTVRSLTAALQGETAAQ
ncbi:MAG TPA: 2-dehydropantoate 2-reductase [Candidatus Dormibacteraeota bacterium]|jgi:2-dehydropantoate 2-reductase|nr:2-dehydropantoate 2-reductase [Candidatus Dormibacteraeota bacterium]